MTTDPFTDAARTEAQARIAAMLELSGASDDIRAWFPAAFEKGAEWGRNQTLAEEPTDAEVLAYLGAFCEALPDAFEWTPDTVTRVKRGLSAARAAQRDKEATR